MEPLKIATVQFETRDNDKLYNLSIIREMCRKASVEGADVVAFHECSVCGYTFAQPAIPPVPPARRVQMINWSFPDSVQNLPFVFLAPASMYPKIFVKFPLESLAPTIFSI